MNVTSMYVTLCPASGKGTEDGRPTAGTWRWFALMDELIGSSAAVSPPVVVGSLPARPGQVRVRVEEEDEVVRGGRAGASTATAAGEGAAGAAGAGAGRRGREDPFLLLVREDILYQRQADERREVESRERFDRFFSLLERLVERRGTRLWPQLLWRKQGALPAGQTLPPWP